MTQEAYYQLMSYNDLIVLILFALTIVAMAIYPRIKHKIPKTRVNLKWIMIIAILLRLPYLGESFWYDETFTSAMTKIPLNHLAGAIMADVHPPLAYLPFWVWSQITVTSSDLMLRLPSLILGLVSIWLGYQIVLSIAPNDALLGAWTLAVMPMHIIYSTEARAYMLLIVLVMVCVLAIIRNRPAWLLVGALLPYTHAHGVIYMGLLILIYTFPIGVNRIFNVVDGKIKSKSQFKLSANPNITSVIIIILAIPAMMIIYAQSSDVSNGFWLRQSGLGGVLALIPNALIGGRYPPIFAIILIPLTFWACIRVTAYYRYSTPQMVMIMIAIATPVITAIIAWGLDLNIILARAMLPTAVLWALLIGLQYPRVYIALVAIPLIYGIIPDYQRMDIRDYFKDCRGSDWVYAPSTTTAIMAHHYLPNVVTGWDSDDTNQSYDVTLFGIPRVTYESLEGDVCVVYFDNPMSEDKHRKFLTTLAPYLYWYHTVNEYTQFFVYRIAKWFPMPITH